MTGSAAGEYVAGHTSMIRRDPVGPIASIAPWNYPLMMAAWKLAAPLAAGCSVVLKPSEITPLSTARGRIAKRYCAQGCIKRDPRRRGHNRGSIDQCAKGRGDFRHRIARHGHGRNARGQSKNPSCASGIRRQGPCDCV